MSFAINRVYTGIGDAGTTRLASGEEVDKSDARIEAYGTIDELNAALGLLAEALREVPQNHDLLTKVRRVQNELFDLGAELATLPAKLHPQQSLVVAGHSERLEAEMDAATAELETLRSFVLPGGGWSSSFAHLSRTICRRAERQIVRLHRETPQRPELLRYVNRLSDWLFVLGRVAVKRSGDQEVLWAKGGA